MLYLIFALISVFMWSIVCHELGHWAYFKWIVKKSVAIRFEFRDYNNSFLGVGWPADYIDLSQGQKFGIYAAGIWTGLLMCIAMLAVLKISLIWWPIPVAIYVWGAWQDIKKIAPFSSIPLNQKSQDQKIEMSD